MGMTIDKTIEFFNGLECHTPQAKDARDVAIDTMRKYQMMQADYEARLKADLEAILVELQLEIEELDSRAGYDGNGMPTFSTDYIRKKKVNELIQQKINALKEPSNDD